MQRVSFEAQKYKSSFVKAGGSAPIAHRCKFVQRTVRTTCPKFRTQRLFAETFCANRYHGARNANRGRAMRVHGVHLGDDTLNTARVGASTEDGLTLVWYCNGHWRSIIVSAQV